MDLRCIPGRAALLLLLLPAGARASFLAGDALDSFANGLAWFIIFAVPIAGVVLFWMVHVLPEKIAEKRHHPQKDSIKVLCILSLFFGGLLWPLAWLWAYTRPVAHKAVYGTERHEDYYTEMSVLADAGELEPHKVDELRHELDVMRAKAPLSPALERLSARLDVLAASAPPPTAPPIVTRQARVAETAQGGTR
jgi:hypothetical protein